MTKIENGNMREMKKENLLAQLWALKALIDDEIASRDGEALLDDLLEE
jgi:hypothetical protein